MSTVPTSPPDSVPAFAPAEAARLAELDAYRILDTEPEAEFDDLVALAAEICEVPVALVSLVADERQWFKAKVGLEACGTPRDISFCQHAMHESDVMIVPDATRDPRFVDNPLVTGELGIRFYAGVPLVSPRGHPLGTLCVIDREPRELGAQQLRMLRLLGRQAMTQLDLSRSLEDTAAALEEAERHRARHAEAVERQREIVLEMAHRMKNSLTIVQSIVSQTLRRATSLEEGRGAIEARLAALGRAQDALTRADVDEVEIGAVILAALAPHGARGEDSRFVLEGEPVLLDPRQALGLSLGLHELATNAVKYGALSVPGGRVRIGWSDDGEAFRFTWREQDGPRVEPPASLGFGSRLVERIVAAYFEGTGDLALDPEGACFTLTGKARSGAAKADSLVPRAG